MNAARATKETWCRLGLALLREEGADRITVDRLCALLKKTKGSFYHHFDHLDGYLAELLRTWERDHTERIIAVIERERRTKRGARLDAAARKIDHGLERAVRAWAMRNEGVRASLDSVDAQRIEFLSSLHGNPDDAILEYALFVGFQQLRIVDDPARAERLNARMHRAREALASQARGTRAAPAPRRGARPRPARAKDRGGR